MRNDLIKFITTTIGPRHLPEQNTLYISSRAKATVDKDVGVVEMTHQGERLGGLTDPKT